MNELEYVTEVERNPLLAFVLLNIIDKFCPPRYINPDVFESFPYIKVRLTQSNYLLTPSRFYRIVYILYRDLKNKGLDLKLPYYWYKSGPIVHLKSTPKVFKIVRLKKTQQIVPTYEKWRELILVFDDCDNCYSDAVIVTINSDKLSKFTKLDVIYEYSPSEFHKILITLLNQLEKIDNTQEVSETNVAALYTLINQLQRSYDIKKYSELQPVLSETLRLTDIYLTKKDLPHVRELTEAFWDVFSLGLKAKENEQINSALLTQWNTEYVAALNTFFNTLAAGHYEHIS